MTKNSKQIFREVAIDNACTTWEKWEECSKALKSTATQVLEGNSGKPGKKEETWWWCIEVQVQEALALKESIKA